MFWKTATAEKEKKIEISFTETEKKSDPAILPRWTPSSKTDHTGGLFYNNNKPCTCTTKIYCASHF